MKIIAKTDVEVTLSEDQVESLALTFLCQKLNWQASFFINDGKVCCPIYCGGSHSWQDVKIIREASEQDYFTAGVFKALKNKQS